jgi:Bardet-Biedl syndrome 5 protein
MTSAKPEDYVWQDREIRFDSRPEYLECRKGEVQIDSINAVEDTKGNNGAKGFLIVTNLRVIWIAKDNQAVNLSVGLGTILTCNIRKAKSKLRGTTQALCIMAKFTARFEFVFTSLVVNSPRLFTTVQAIMRAYETSKLYRELKLRGSIMKDNNLMLLPLEQLFNKYTGVWNLSSDQGNLGTFYFTNVRLIWHANLANNFNVSCPYMQISSITIRNSKFGKALVVETFKRAGGYILGFRLDPESALKEVEKELTALYTIYSSVPIFGIEHTIEQAIGNSTNDINQLRAPRIEEDSEIFDDIEDAHAVAAYYADDPEENNNDNGDDDGKKNVKSVSYDERLGLAIETLPREMSIETLWRVM